MSTSVPDGISFEDLEGLATQAAAREEAESKAEAEADEPTFDGKTQQEVQDIASEALTKALEKCNDPIGHKIIILEALSNMVEWHTKVGIKQFDEDEERSGVCWTRDAGKFQACMDILMNIQIGPDDFALQGK